ncbi:MAG TPA: ATP-dependent helicase HrpB [Tepidisphaeraceae bacterium]|jgi:ATP-dependent helicase HrpB|nr:ATP-dependent helicase HrpB [Tepidisphaeraceae bacterium]
MPVPLPIDNQLPQIVAHVREARRLVLVASPGAGKTTRVPPAILRAGLLGQEHPNIVMLQPRRVAARAAAERIADENGWRVGGEVGYHVRFDRKIGRDTRLRVMTEGILTRQLLDDPLLDGVGCVILDEFHERSIHTDLAAALLKEVCAARPELIIIVMSATLDAQPVARFLDDAPIVTVEGRTYPIDVAYTPPSGNPIETRIAAALDELLSDPTRDDAGDVLVFLPGAGEINRAARALSPLASRNDLLVLPLHGSLPPDQQSLALRPANRRKVILATNIAETSLTINGVRTVIDSGLARVAGYDVRRGLDRLEVRRISNASATQRAGRAGRTAPGRCIRLWTQREQNELEPFELPEIRRVDLAATVLTLHAWGRADVRAFEWYEAPDERTLAAAERLLFLLGLTDAERNGRITKRGEQAAQLPVHPRLGRMLVDARQANLWPQAATMAALLSEKDIATFEGRPHERVARTHGRSDLLVRLEMLDRAEHERFGGHLRDSGVDPEAARTVARVRDELRRGAPGANEVRNATVPDDDALLRLALSAYPDRVCRRRGGDASAAVMVGGAGVRLANESIVKTAEYFVAVDARADDRARAGEAIVRIASEIDPTWLAEMFPQAVVRERVHVFDDAKQRVVARSTTRFLDLPLAEDDNAAVDNAVAGAILAAALRPRARAWFSDDEAAANVLARVALLRQHMAEHDWPLFDDAELGDVLAEACSGRRSVDEVRRTSPVSLLESRLPFPLDRLLEQQAPQAIAVPSGSRMKLDYTTGPSPVLAVRLQELFGWTETPRVANGRVPIVLHLLGPNYRPVQVTQDLKNFWATTYFQVRKDLKARYPKHAWPEDPLKAPAERRGRSTKH